MFRSRQPDAAVRRVGQVHQQVARKGTLEVEIPLDAIRCCRMVIPEIDALPQTRRCAQAIARGRHDPFGEGITQIAIGRDAIQGCRHGGIGAESRGGKGAGIGRTNLQPRIEEARPGANNRILIDGEGQPGARREVVLVPTVNVA